MIRKTAIWLMNQYNPEHIFPSNICWFHFDFFHGILQLKPWLLLKDNVHVVKPFLAPWLWLVKSISNSPLDYSICDDFRKVINTHGFWHRLNWPVMPELPHNSQWLDKFSWQELSKYSIVAAWLENMYHSVRTLAWSYPFGHACCGYQYLRIVPVRMSQNIYTVSNCVGPLKKIATHCKYYNRYLHKTSTIVFIIFTTIQLNSTSLARSVVKLAHLTLLFMYHLTWTTSTRNAGQLKNK